MPIHSIVSASPCLDFEGEPAAEPLRTWYRDLHGPEGWSSWWIVPTSRRRRAVARTVTRGSRLPLTLTLEGLVQYLAGFSRLRARTLGNAGRLLRIARACQEIESGPLATVGRILQVDRFASQWRASHSTAPAGHTIGSILTRYDELLQVDDVLDYPALLRKLAHDLKDPTGPLARRVSGRRILLDGFEHFSDAELALLKSLADHAEVRLWLVVTGPDAGPILEELGIRDPHVDRRNPNGELAAFGRALFRDTVLLPAPVECLTSPTPEQECRDVAAHVKALVRSTGVRLSDVAVVIPVDAYLPIVLEACASAGLLATPSAEAFSLAESRPVRALLAVLRLIRRGWPTDDLFDFLRQPLVQRRLRERSELNWLLERSPTGADRQDATSWIQLWRLQIDEHESIVDGADSGAAARTARLRSLVSSIEEMLAPIREIEAEFASTIPQQVPRLIESLGLWFDQLDLSGRLSPAGSPDWSFVPARDWEIDQLAFNNLKDVFDELLDLPASDLPLRPDRRIDLEWVLKLALAAETFQTGSSDDAGIQIVKTRSIRGSRFRAIYAIGLVEGVVPQDPGYPLEDDDIAKRKRKWRDESLSEQLGHFVQLFESASDRIVLSRPHRRDGVTVMESPFLREARRKLGRDSEPFPARPIVDVREALADPAIVEGHAAEFRSLLASRGLWLARTADSVLRIEDWAMPLLRIRYPADRAFGATSLEEYAACPFRHFVSATLGLGELGRDDSALRWGSVFHDAVDRAYRSGSADPRPIGERFRDHLHHCLAGARPALDSTYWHDFEHALFAAYESVTDFLSKNDFKQVESEWEQKAAEIPDGAGGMIRLHVKIDRIDRRASDGMELICDFKTGRLPSRSRLRDRIETGRALQLPLYGLVRQTVTGQPVRHGLYVHFNRRIDSKPENHSSFLVQLETISPSGPERIRIPFDPEVAGITAAGLVQRLRSGRIELSCFDVDDRDPACSSYCPARHACRHPKGY